MNSRGSLDGCLMRVTKVAAELIQQVPAIADALRFAW
jgi:hypothetical protein